MARTGAQPPHSSPHPQEGHQPERRGRTGSGWGHLIGQQGHIAGSTPPSQNPRTQKLEEPIGFRGERSEVFGPPTPCAAGQVSGWPGSDTHCKPMQGRARCPWGRACMASSQPPKVARATVQGHGSNHPWGGIAVAGPDRAGGHVAITQDHHGQQVGTKPGKWGHILKPATRCKPRPSFFCAGTAGTAGTPHE